MARYIRITESPLEHADKAYKAGFYVEAIQVLHGAIEFKLREMLMLIGSVYFDAKLKETWDLADQSSLINAANTLHILGQLTRDDLNELVEVNRCRNELIHKIFHEPYEKSWFGYPVQKYQRIYSIAKKWMGTLEIRVFEISERDLH